MAALPGREAAAVVRLNSMSQSGTVFLSIIMPVLNEGAGLNAFIEQVLDLVGEGNQVIVVDGGSQDDSFNQLNDLSESKANLVLVNSIKGRALQMNAGAKVAVGENLLFLHADTYLPNTSIYQLEKFSETLFLWGRFDVRLNNSAWPYKIISWFINKRSRLTAISTGDQAIFVRRNVFEQIKGYKQQPLMEDIELSRQLGAHSKPLCLRSKVITSPRKWQQEGLVRTVLLMWAIRLKYFLGVSAEQLVKDYYRK